MYISDDNAKAIQEISNKMEDIQNSWRHLSTDVSCLDNTNCNTG
jgi:hypothetical protein